MCIVSCQNIGKSRLGRVLVPRFPQYAWNVCGKITEQDVSDIIYKIIKKEKKKVKTLRVKKKFATHQKMAGNRYRKQRKN